MSPAIKLLYYNKMEKLTEHQERTKKVHNNPIVENMIQDVRDQLFVKLEVRRQANGLCMYNLAQWMQAKTNKQTGQGSDVMHNVYFDN